MYNMVKWLKSAVCIAGCAALISGSFMLTGCSTPKVAAVIDGEQFSTGEYLAYLFNAYYTTFNNTNLHQYPQYGMDPWEEKLSYGEGDDAEELSVEQYIIRLTQDTMIRHKALSNMMSEYDITISEEDQQSLETHLADVSNDAMLALGFNKESYEKMYRAVNFYEATLFFGLYDEGGAKAMTEQELRDYFDENILTYKIVEISLLDEDGGDLDEDGIEKVMDRLEGYLEMYQQSKDFNKVIDQYQADEQAKYDDDNEDNGDQDEENQQDDEDEGDQDDDDNEDNEDDEDEQDEVDPNVLTLDATIDENQEDLIKAIQSVEVGNAKVVEYKKNGDTNTAALILRLDPDETDYNFEESRERIIYGAKYKDFDNLIKTESKKLSVEFNKTVVNRCTPKQLEKDAERE